jgi:hypothetical protein
VLATMPAKAATLRLTVRKDRLYLEGASVPCVWQVKNRPIPLPINPTVAHLARLVYNHTYEEIQSAGLEDAVGEAIDQREQAILIATRALKPFGITEDELRALVDAKLEALPEP